MGLFPVDSDGTFAVPFWLKLATNFIPSVAIRTVVKALLEAWDRLPAPKREEVVRAAQKSTMAHDISHVVTAVHEVMGRNVTDKMK